VFAREHIARFFCQSKKVFDPDFLKLISFSNSLTRDAFTWFIYLPPNSVQSWNDM